MTQLAYSRSFAPRSTLVDELKELVRATPLALFVGALKSAA